MQRFAKPPGGVTCLEGSNPSLSASLSRARSSADRASGCGPEGRGFESRRARHLPERNPTPVSLPGSSCAGAPPSASGPWPGWVSGTPSQRREPGPDPAHRPASGRSLGLDFRAMLRDQLVRLVAPRLHRAQQRCIGARHHQGYSRASVVAATRCERPPSSPPRQGPRGPFGRHRSRTIDAACGRQPPTPTLSGRHNEGAGEEPASEEDGEGRAKPGPSQVRGIAPASWAQGGSSRHAEEEAVEDLIDRHLAHGVRQSLWLYRPRPGAASTAATHRRPGSLRRG